MRGATISLAILLTTAGCSTARPVLAESPAAELDGAGHEWTALSAMTIGLMFASVATEQREAPCLSVTRLESTTIWIDECTDVPGRLVVRRGPGRLSARYHDYTRAPMLRGRINGRVRVDERGEQINFFVDLTIADDDDAELTAIAYEGQTSVDLLDLDDWDADAPAVWSGAGAFASDEFGKVELVTTAQRMNEGRCGSEPLSGTLEARAGGRVAVLSYDGERDCDVEGTATWTLDGEPMGELSGIHCDVDDHDPRRGWPWLIIILALGGRARRARRDPGP